MKMCSITNNNTEDIHSNDILKVNTSATYGSTNLVFYFLHQYWIDESDPRIKDYWLLNEGPGMFLFIMLSWLLFVTHLGPYLMKGRKPFVLTDMMMVYNFTLVIINIFGVYASLKFLDYGKKVFQLKLPDRIGTSDATLGEINDKMILFYSKLLDLLDTVFSF